MSAERPYLTVAQLRSGAAAAVAELGADWREVPFPLDLDQVPAGYADHPFAVVVGPTQFDRRYRSGERVGVWVRSRLTVLILSPLVPDLGGAQLSSLDAAAAAEQEVIELVLDDSPAVWRQDALIDLDQVDRQIPPDSGLILSTVVCTVAHVLPLR